MYFSQEGYEESQFGDWGGCHLKNCELQAWNFLLHCPGQGEEESINIIAVGLRESLLGKGRRSGRSHDFPGRQEGAFN